MSIYYTRRVIRFAYTSGAGSFSSGYLYAGEADSLVAAQSTRLDVSGVPFCPLKVWRILRESLDFSPH